MNDIKSSEITPERLFLSRRRFLACPAAKAAGTLAAGCGQRAPQQDRFGGDPRPTPGTDELNDPWTSYDSVVNYNNFFEFSMDKEAVARLARGFKTSPWTVEVVGLVNKPGTYGLEDLLGRFPQEERIYRMRCVEAWSMVIPWTGFSLGKLPQEVEPTSRAAYVRFQTLPT